MFSHPLPKTLSNKKKSKDSLSNEVKQIFWTTPGARGGRGYSIENGWVGVFN